MIHTELLLKLRYCIVPSVKMFIEMSLEAIVAWGLISVACFPFSCSVGDRNVTNMSNLIPPLQPWFSRCLDSNRMMSK